MTDSNLVQQYSTLVQAIVSLFTLQPYFLREQLIIFQVFLIFFFILYH